MDDFIDKALGLRPIKEFKEENETTSIVKISENEKNEISKYETEVDDSAVKEYLEDIEKSRSNIETMLDQGNQAFKELVTLAKQSESPRAFEVVSTMMKSLLDANKEFVEMSSKRRYTKEEILNPPKEEKEQQANVTNNNLILTTTDLLKMLKGDTSQ